MKAIIFVALVSALSLVAVPAEAGHAPNSYCSESGDVCASAREVDGKRLLRIVTAAKYFETYKVCVTAPDNSRTCRNGMMRDKDGDGVWTGSTNWAERFPNEGPGAYSVRWSSGGYRSPRLGFHVAR